MEADMQLSGVMLSSHCRSASGDLPASQAASSWLACALIQAAFGRN